ncbi:putative dolichol-P-glucose synthetase [Porphyromonas crevioricanis JCM 15906]|uniref:Putative dolichol-P-glucose synthetase n=1 Tax=Porphyromonas crevioricanis JCM 15906 TaxID=1305617 RepID=T1DTZ2_9PORP|nr:lysylphosphatidylglycerol synthase transmembrane domain-containing protein [Porphyromonas crevioricanis]GAD06114.1 putative dolichol-P-glucose synthetase [Porphyromonas crevioricanis JCM 15906]SJZ91585.1 hypothetical protein SAMN02745203_01256 [Porphyromonas crevioricanis]
MKQTNSPKVSPLRSLTKVIIPLCFGVLILWLVYRNLDLEEVQEALNRGFNIWYILLSLIFGLAANVVRGLRWQLLIEPVATPKPKALNAVLTTLGTYTVNMALPRAGELWRCAEEGRYERLPFAQLLGTLFMDRIMDLVAVGLIFLGVLLGAGDFLFRFFADNQSSFGVPGIATIFSSMWLYVGFVILVVGTLVSYKYLRQTKPMKKLVEMVSKVIQGLYSIWHMKRKWLFLLYTVLLWLGYFLYFYTTFFAFGFTSNLGFGVGLVAFTMGSIAMAVPVQGGIGAWHFMVINTLTSYGIAKVDAATFALVVHTIQTLWITIVGFVSIMLLPLVNKGYNRVSSHPEV